MTPFLTLFYKEVLRFYKVSVQTIIAPILSSLLYLLIFGSALHDKISVFESISYTSFLVPGLIMMSVLQNAFANSSSSLIQSKINGSLVFVQLAPLSYFSWFCAYLLAAILRGVAVGVGVFIVTFYFYQGHFFSPFLSLLFLVLSAAILGTLGIIAGIWAEKFDHLASFQNFLIMPATFLSGVFYSVQNLPSFWQMASRFNPFFYMVDGFRYGFFGKGDTPLSFCLIFTVLFFAFLVAIALTMLKSGYKLRR